jgi:hypothetical protein
MQNHSRLAALDHVLAGIDQKGVEQRYCLQVHMNPR